MQARKLGRRGQRGPRDPAARAADGPRRRRDTEMRLPEAGPEIQYNKSVDHDNTAGPNAPPDDGVTALRPNSRCDLKSAGTSSCDC